MTGTSSAIASKARCDSPFNSLRTISAQRKPILNRDQASTATAGRWTNYGIDFHQYRMGDCGMLSRVRNAALIVGAISSLVVTGEVLNAQQPAAVAAPAGPGVNAVAPDFTLVGASRYGLLKTPVKLSDYRGRTVVLAFFYQARTKG
jgi:uncharacterized protein YjlB